MRYYFINQEMKEFSIDVELGQENRFDFLYEGAKKSLLLRKLAGKHFYSFDGVAWNKLPSLGVNEILVSNSEVYKVYRGYKPSGLNKGGAGALITQMPGKIVKIMKKEGDKVNVGETVLILEAMKMENEIKSGVTGIIKSINVKEGQPLESGFLMVEIEE